MFERFFHRRKSITPIIQYRGEYLHLHDHHEPTPVHDLLWNPYAPRNTEECPENEDGHCNTECSC